MFIFTSFMLRPFFAMAFMSDEIFDQGLDYADTNLDRVDITSQEATNYTEATSTYSLGNDTVNTGAT